MIMVARFLPKDIFLGNLFGMEFLKISKRQKILNFTLSLVLARPSHIKDW